MPIELTWLIPDTILLSRWIGVIDEDDICVLVDEIGLILDSATRSIHSIIDMSEATDISPNAAYGYLQSRISQHPKRGRIGLVGTSFQSEALADVLNRVTQRELFRLFGSRAEARDYLLSHDTPPPTLQPGIDDKQLRTIDDPDSVTP